MTCSPFPSLTLSAPASAATFSSESSSSPSSPSSSVSSLPPSSTSLWTRFVFAVFIVLVYVSTASEACFIRDCPIGGKRSLGQGTIARRQCMPCGPLNAGQCVGPSICCGPSIGCHIGTLESQVCRKEDESTVPCFVKGKACGANNDGNCVADGICCDSDSCAYNERCRDANGLEDPMDKDKSQILRLISRILQKKRNY